MLNQEILVYFNNKIMHHNTAVIFVMIKVKDDAQINEI